MAQNNVDFSIDPSGEQLLDELLTNLQENIQTSNSGSTRPTYAKNGTVWVDKTTTPWVWKMFNGTDDIIIGNIDPTSLHFTPSNIPQILDNYSATAAPTVNDDEGDGYEAGSKWFYDGDIWLCVNSTSGGAQWVDTGVQLTDLGTLAGLNEVAFANIATDVIATQTDAETGTATDKLMTPLRTKQAIEALVGSVDRTWTDVTGSRTQGIVYTNSTGEDIEVLMTWRGGGSYGGYDVEIDGNLVSEVQFTGPNTSYADAVSFIVPDSSTYEVSQSGSGALQKWWELR